MRDPPQEWPHSEGNHRGQTPKENASDKTATARLHLRPVRRRRRPQAPRHVHRAARRERPRPLVWESVTTPSTRRLAATPLRIDVTSNGQLVSVLDNGRASPRHPPEKASRRPEVIRTILHAAASSTTTATRSPAACTRRVLERLSIPFEIRESTRRRGLDAALRAGPQEDRNSGSWRSTQSAARSSLHSRTDHLGRQPLHFGSAVETACASCPPEQTPLVTSTDERNQGTSSTTRRHQSFVEHLSKNQCRRSRGTRSPSSSPRRTSPRRWKSVEVSLLYNDTYDEKVFCSRTTINNREGGVHLAGCAPASRAPFTPYAAERRSVEGASRSSRGGARGTPPPRGARRRPSR